jgi:hypothetical protein
MVWNGTYAWALRLGMFFLVLEAWFYDTLLSVGVVRVFLKASE